MSDTRRFPPEVFDLDLAAHRPNAVEVSFVEPEQTPATVQGLAGPDTAELADCLNRMIDMRARACRQSRFEAAVAAYEVFERQIALLETDGNLSGPRDTAKSATLRGMVEVRMRHWWRSAAAMEFGSMV